MSNTDLHTCALCEVLALGVWSTSCSYSRYFWATFCLCPSLRLLWLWSQTNSVLPLSRERVCWISRGNPHKRASCTHDPDPAFRAATGTTPCEHQIHLQAELGPVHIPNTFCFSDKRILCKARFRNQPGFVCCNVSQLLSTGNMKQMSSESVDREARKHSLISK